MSLPCELLDEILSYLPSDDKQTFQNCSLVEKSWINPSRRRLFEWVYLQVATLQLWRDRIPPVYCGFLHHVRWLIYAPHDGPWSERYFTILRDYFPFLHQLRRLHLDSACLPSAISRKIEIFSAFRYTLSRLTLSSCDVTVGALVALINYFPNLNRLNLRHSRKIDDKLIPPLSRPLLGQLYIAQTYEDLGLLDQLSGLGLVFDEILFNSGLRVHTRTLRRIVDGVGVNVERLRLLDPLSRDGMQTPSQAEPTPKLTESNTMFLQTVRKTNQQYSPVAESSRN